MPPAERRRRRASRSPTERRFEVESTWKPVFSRLIPRDCFRSLTKVTRSGGQIAAKHRASDDRDGDSGRASTDDRAKRRGQDSNGAADEHARELAQITTDDDCDDDRRANRKRRTADDASECSHQDADRSADQGTAASGGCQGFIR
jgi:hypothetical protein